MIKRIMTPEKMLSMHLFFFAAPQHPRKPIKNKKIPNKKFVKFR